MLEMVRKGVGMAQMPCVLVEPDFLLHRIPARTARIRIFRDILVEELEKQKARIEGREL